MKGLLPYIKNGIISLAAFLILYVIAAAMLNALLIGAYYAGIISANSLQFMQQAALLTSLSIAVFAYSKIYKHEKLSETVEGLGLSKAGISANVVWLAILILIMVFLLEAATSAYGSASSTVISTNAGIIFTGAPLWFYAFVAVIEPINEEIMFRGFMVNRLGIVASAIIFGLLHASYDSTFAIEVIAALFFGLITGYVFRKSGSLYPGIIAHIAVNSIAALALLGALG